MLSIQRAVVCVMVLIALMTAVSENGANGAIWIEGTGNWNVEDDWSPAVVPNSSTIDVVIGSDLDNDVTVTLNMNAEVGHLTLDAGDALHIAGGHHTLSIFGDLTNNGFILANPAGSFQYVTNENGVPFGTYQFGEALGGQWLDGGSPASGITVGDSKTFIFDVTGPDAGSLSVMDFFRGGQLNNHKGESDVVFSVRFKGFEDDDSNKASGNIVPTPAAVWPGLALLGGLLLRRRRIGERL